MTPFYTILISIGVNIVVFLVGFAVVWGKVLSRLESLERTVNRVSSVILAGPGENRIITQNDCVLHSRECWARIEGMMLLVNQRIDKRNYTERSEHHEPFEG